MHYVTAKGILSSGNGMNLYRGCSHGCIYCDSRSVCYGMQHDFEDIEVKQNAPVLLETALRSKRKRCMIATGAMTDPYLPLEKEIKLTRKSLELISRYAFGLAIQTKSDLILRDIDLLEEINQKAKCVVEMTLTTADDALCQKIEPAVCATSRRAEVLAEMQKRNIPTIVWLSPILPFINDTEENIRGIIKICRECGVKGIICFGMGLTLREGNREYFYEKLDQNFPGLKQKYIETFGNAYMVNSPKNKALMELFTNECKRYGIMHDTDEIFSYMRELPESYEQLSLF